MSLWRGRHLQPPDIQASGRRHRQPPDIQASGTGGACSRL